MQSRSGCKHPSAERPSETFNQTKESSEVMFALKFVIMFGDDFKDPPEIPFKTIMKIALRGFISRSFCLARLFLKQSLKRRLGQSAHRGQEEWPPLGGSGSGTRCTSPELLSQFNMLRGSPVPYLLNGSSSPMPYLLNGEQTTHRSLNGSR